MTVLGWVTSVSTYGQHAFLENRNLSSRVSPILKLTLAVLDDPDSINIEITTTEPQSISNQLELLDASVIRFQPLGGSKYGLIVTLTKTNLFSLLQNSATEYFELYRSPFTELKQEGLDLTLNEIKLSHHRYADLNGSSITVSIKENLIDSNDIDFKNRLFFTAESPDDIDVHASNMASIIGGGGNSDVTSLGVAWDCRMTSDNFMMLLPSAPDYFLDNGISVQNHSYGTGIENYYGIETSQYDELCNTIPSLMHVFSSGNAGDQAAIDGSYANLPGWANLTGQFKHSKNIITVGATDSLNRIVPLSSRGPAYDGRIKPEIVAYGHGGTSGAAAIVSGSVLLLQEAYAQDHHDSLPPSELIKAVIINTAKDIETPGPDFTSGFGALRISKAIESIQRQEYALNKVEELATIEIPIVLPSNVSELKVTIVWNDPAAPPQSIYALVNNVDLQLEEQVSGQIILPWVLKAFPNSDSLIASPLRGVDQLNNVEQITVTDPASGEYIIRIHGTDLKTVTQTFAVTWMYSLENEFEWVFPSGSDFLQPATKSILRWNTTEIVKSQIEYREIPGEEWISLSSEIDPSADFFIWDVPGYSGAAQLRWMTADHVILSDTFLIASPLRPDVVFVCRDSLMITWPSLPEADSFELFRIGEQHMEHLLYQQDTFQVLNDTDTSRRHFALAYYTEGIRSPMGFTGDYLQQGAGCFIDLFYLDHTQGDSAFLIGGLGSIDGLISVTLQILQQNQFIDWNIIAPITSTNFSWIYDALRVGRNVFRLRLFFENGNEVYSDIVDVYYQGNQQILIYPNPTSATQSTKIYVYDADEFDLTIYDMTGRTIMERKNLSEPLLEIDMTYPPGIYQVVIFTNDKRTFSTKFMIR